MLGWCYNVDAQSGLSISSGTLSINANTVFLVDGLVLQPTSSFTLSGPNSVTRTTTIAHTAPQPYISRVFQLAATTNSFSGSISIYYNDTELNGLSESGLTLNIHNGGGWSAFNSGVTRDGINNVVTTSGLANINLNELTLANVTTPLPLDWGPVTALRKEGGAHVQWQTYNEVATSHFVVERSLNGVQWTAVGLPVAARNQSGDQHYSLTDALITPAQTYYRIKQVDEDGRYSYSPVVTVKAIAATNHLTLYPNPTQGRIQLQSTALPINTITMYDA